jgi:dihydrofolate reductase
MFQVDSFDDEPGEGLTRMMATVDTVVLGRVSCQEWAGYWPTASGDEDFAAFINPVEKYVASRTLSEPLEWQNPHLMDAPLEEFLATLRERDGGEIAVCRSISVTRQLLFAGLLDPLTLLPTLWSQEAAAACSRTAPRSPVLYFRTSPGPARAT